MKPLKQVILLQTLILLADLSYIIYLLTGIGIFASISLTENVRLVFTIGSSTLDMGTLGGILVFLPLTYFGWLLIRHNDNELLRSANRLGATYISLMVFSLLSLVINYLSFMSYQSGRTGFGVTGLITGITALVIFIAMIIFAITLDHPTQQQTKYRRWFLAIPLGYVVIGILSSFILSYVLSYLVGTDQFDQIGLYTFILQLITNTLTSILLLIIFIGLRGIFQGAEEVEDSNLAYPQQVQQY